jgi:hypothetical protein
MVREKPEKSKSIETLSASSEEVSILTRQDYTNTVRQHRVQFIHRLFSQEINSLFERLREDADRMRSLHGEISIVCPEHLDVDIIEERLCQYFHDLGYKTIPGPRKDGDRNIIITLT